MKIQGSTCFMIAFVGIVTVALSNGHFDEFSNKTLELGLGKDTVTNATDSFEQLDLPTLDGNSEPIGACKVPVIDLDSVTYDCHHINPDKYSCSNQCGSVLEPDWGAYCSCDPGCGIHQDCCRDFHLQCPTEYNISVDILNKFTPDPAIECEPFNMKDYKMVVQCLNGTRCEDLDRNWLDLVPVMDKATWITYLNTNCAACNNIDSVTPWPSKITCQTESILTTLTSLDAVQSAVEDGLCFIQVEDIGHVCTHVISTCPEDCANKDLVEMCHNGSVQLVESSHVVHIMDGTYKNEYCLMCNVPFPGLTCTRCSFCQNLHNNILSLFSFSLLMDINPKQGLKIGFNVNGVNQEFECDSTTNCTSACNEGYDYTNGTCIHVYTPHTIIVNITFGIASSMQHAFDISVMMEEDFIRNTYAGKFAAAATSYDMIYSKNILNATLSIMFQDLIQADDNVTGIEYHTMIFHILKNGYDKHIEDFYLHPIQDVDFHNVCVKGIGVLTCWDWNNETMYYERNNLVEDTLVMSSESTMGIVTIVCLSVSIICMIIRMILQIFVPVFHTFAGKLQFLMVLTLCLATLFKLLGPLAFRLPDICSAMGILTHYFYLVTFTWMSIIALDMYLVFRAGLSVASRGLKRLLAYSLVAFLLPGLIVGTAGILDGVAQGSVLRPDYGVPVCMITNRFSLLLFFAGPLAVMIIFNVTMFSLTVHNLRKSWKDAKSVKTKRNENHFDVYIKLFILMGFTWVFGFIAPFADQEGLWYIFIVLNASQGVFIFVASVCTRRVLRSLGCMEHLTSRGSSYLTRSSSIGNSGSVSHQSSQIRS